MSLTFHEKEIGHSFCCNAKQIILWTFSGVGILQNIHFFAEYKAIVTGQLAKLSINNSSFAIK